MSVQFYREQKDFEMRPSLISMLRSLISPRPFIKGLDINRNQANQLISAQKIKDAGYEFAILEACWGLWEPPTFRTFWPPLVDAGVIVLGYGFFRGDQPGGRQAEFLLEIVRKMYEAQGFWMPLALDVEPWQGDSSNMNNRIDGFHDWVNVIYPVVRPLIYSNQPSWRSQMNDIPLIEPCIAWPANYRNTTYPLLFDKCTQERSPFHQVGVATVHSWCPAVPGMSSDVCVDRFYGTKEDLLALRKGDVPAPEPPPEDDMTKETILARISAMKEDLAEDVAELDVLAAEVNELPVGGTTPPPTPTPTTRRFYIDEEKKSLACYYKDVNGNGKPIMLIYENPRYIYGDKDVWPNVNSGIFATITNEAPIAGDGSNPGPWYRIADKKKSDGGALYIDYRDGYIANG